MDKVLQLSVDKLGVDDFLNFPLWFVINYNRRWWGLDLAREWVRGRRFKKRDMENRVDLHGGGKVKFIGMGGDFLDDLKLP